MCADIGPAVKNMTNLHGQGLEAAGADGSDPAGSAPANLRIPPK